MRSCVARATVSSAFAATRHTTTSAKRAARQVHRGYASLVNVDTASHELSPNISKEGSSRRLSSTRLDNAQTLTRLHTVRGLLPRVLAPDSPELAFWNKALEEAADQLSGPLAEDKTLNVVVYSMDEQAGGSAIVQALLEDPFSTEADLIEVRERWKGKGNSSRIDIRSGPPPMRASTSTEASTSQAISSDVYLKSNFFASIPAPVQLTELRPTSHAPSPDTLRLLYSADVPIVVVNPLTTPLPFLSPLTDPFHSSENLFPFTLPPHALVLVASASPASSSEAAQERLGRSLGVPASHILFVDPKRAESAAHALGSSTPTALNVQRYHDDSLGSGLSGLRQTLAKLLDPTSKPRARQADALLRAALVTSQGELARATAEMSAALHTATELCQLASTARASADNLVLGTPSPSSGAGRDNVQAALVSADEIVRPVVNALWPQPLPAVALGPGENKAIGYARRWSAFWRRLLPRLKLSTLGAADDVAWVIGQAVRNAWTGGIERTLLPAYSPLSPLQARTTAEALNRLAALPPSLRSSLLHNTLQQLSHAPDYPLVPSALLTPLSARLRRLNEGPTAVLGRSAQTLAARVAGSAVGGVGVAGGTLAWTHGADVLLGSGMTALSSDIGTAAGAGLLVAVGGVRWALGRWERARKAWLADWDRMREGAERELKAEYVRVMEEQVLRVPVKAKEGVEDLVAKRKLEVDELVKEVRKIEECLVKEDSK
ncbi:unnamed protein product [Peniophora sp. CBMAI 1063]|nr:unnamed protein product [Peniophora sp. CBMAI 1063]